MTTIDRWLDSFLVPPIPFESVEYGTGQPAFDWSDALDEKDALVGQLRQENYVNVADHFDTALYEGHGRFADDTDLEIDSGPDAGARITGDKVLVATGSSRGSRQSRGSKRSTTRRVSRS